MLHHNPAEAKGSVRRKLHDLVRAADLPAAARAAYGDGVAFHGQHPVNEVVGIDAVARQVWAPLREGFERLRRVDLMLTGGSFQGRDWISAMGHFHGEFVRPYLGIPPLGNWATVRFGEFHEIEDGRIVRSYVIFDLPDLMRQAGVFPWRPGLGVETLQPGPASGDGVVLHASDPAESAKSLDLVEAMIFEGLLEPAGDVSTADQMRAYWTEDMMWYGPSLIGTTMGIENFYRIHEHPWERGISPRGPKPTREKKHVTRFGDGPFCSFTGWPSIYATHSGPFLGLPASGKDLDIRVMDFYHRRGDFLDENWIFIDFPHLFLQLGIDLFDRMAALRDGRSVPRPWIA